MPAGALNLALADGALLLGQPAGLGGRARILTSASEASSAPAAAAAPATAPAAGDAAAAPAAAAGGAEQPPPVPKKVLIYTSPTGKTVEVDGDTKAKCLKSCENAAELKDENQTGVNEVMSIATGGEASAVADCAKFCEAEFQGSCFPGDSTVLVKGRGRVQLCELSAGDSVLALGCLEPPTLIFDTVIAWLHRDPCADGDVLQLSHEMGQVQLTSEHLVFVRKPGMTSAVAIRAEEVQPGDHLLAPFLDGCVVQPMVLGVERVRKHGLYAPLLSSGTLFVDGTAASCYALPQDLQSSPLLRRVARLASGGGLHAAAHAAFCPVRLLHLASTCRGARSKALCPEGVVGLHPYAWALYALAASFLA